MAAAMVVPVAVAGVVSGCAGSSSDSVPAGADPADAIWVLDIDDCRNRPGQRATGFVVDTGAGPILVSVAHAVEQARAIGAVGDDGVVIPLTIHHLDADLDIGIYSAPGDAALSLEPDARPEAAAVWVRRNAADTASPVEVDVLRWVDVELDGTGKRLGLELGRPSNSTDDPDTDDAAIDGDLIRSGDSGAPVIDRDTGDVVGMVFATARTGDRGWATAALAIDEALASTDLEASLELSCDE